MSDVQGTASLEVSQVVAGLRQMQVGIASLTKGMSQLNNESDKTKRTLKETFKDAGQAASKTGGALGSWSSKLFGGASMEGAFSRVAVGLSLVTLGFRSYEAAVQRSIEKTQAMIAAKRNLRQADDRAKETIEAMAKKGEAQVTGRIGMIAVGGKRAADDADMVASTGAASFDDAQKGVASIYGRFGQTTRASNAVDIAMRGAMGGLDFAEVAKELTRHGGAIDDASMADRLLGRMAMQQTGARGNPEEIWAERMRNINADDFLMKAREQASHRSGIPALERKAFMSSAIGQKEVAQQATPHEKEMLTEYQKHTQAVQELLEQAKTQNRLMEIIANRWGGPGSYRRQAADLEEGFARANGLGPPAPGPAQVFPTGPYDPRAFGPFGR